MDLYGDIPRLVLWRQILAQFFLIAHGETVSFVWHAVKPLGTQAVSKKRRCYWEQRPVLNLWMTSGGRLGWWVPLFFFWVGDGSKNKKTYGGLNGKIISKCWEYDGIDGKRRLAGTIFLGILDFDNFFREIHGRNPRACIIIFPNIFREFQYHIAIFSMKITWEIPWKYHNNP